MSFANSLGTATVLQTPCVYTSMLVIVPSTGIIPGNIPRLMQLLKRRIPRFSDGGPAQEQGRAIIVQCQSFSFPASATAVKRN